MTRFHPTLSIRAATAALATAVAVGLLLSGAPPATSDVGAPREATALPGPRSEAAAFAWDEHLLVAGGCHPCADDGAATRSVLLATLQADASLGAWENTSALPEARAGLALAAWPGAVVYALGGRSLEGVPAAHDDVWRAQVLSGGTLGLWQATKPLPTPRFHHAALVHEGVLYAVGGHDGAGPIPDVDLAFMNVDGSLVGWVRGDPLPGPREGHAVAIVDGSLYVFGGRNATGPAKDVLRALILGDGTLDVWQDAGTWNGSRAFMSVSAWEDRVLVAGGSTRDGPAANVQVGLFRDRRLSFTDSATLPEVRQAPAGAALGRAAYVVGGRGSHGEERATVYEIPLEGRQAPFSSGSASSPSSVPGSASSGSAAPGGPASGTPRNLRLGSTVTPFRESAAGRALLDTLDSGLPRGFCCGQAAWSGRAAFLFGPLVEDSIDPLPVLRFHPASGALDVMAATMPQDAFAAPAAVWVDGRAYLFGVRERDPSLFRYDPMRDELVRLPIRLDAGTSPAAALVGGQVFVVTGWDALEARPGTIWRFDPDQRSVHRMQASIPRAQGGATVVAADGRLFVFGADPDGRAYEFEPATDTARPLATQLPLGARGAAAVWDGRHVYLFGGQGEAQTLHNGIQRFDPATGSAEVLDLGLPAPRAAASVAWDGDHAYILGGLGVNGSFRDVLVFTPPEAPPSLATIPAVPAWALTSAVVLLALLGGTPTRP